MNELGERVRLFTALELPAHVREELARWCTSALAGVSELRALSPDSLHVTLCFLGWRFSSELDAIAAALDTVSAHEPASLSISRAIWLPLRRPRVLAIELLDSRGLLAAAQAGLSRALSTGGWYAPEARRFLAHVTVARVQKGARIRGTELPDPPRLSFDAAAVTLFRSRLGGGGARYEALRTVELGSGTPADPLSVVRRFHAAQNAAYAGDGIEPLSELLSDEVVWHVPGRSAIAGEHRGRDAVLAYLELRSRMTDASFRVIVHGVEIIAGHVVQLAGGTAERFGRELRWETVGMFRVADGRIAECWLLPLDQRQFDEIWT